MQARLKVIQDNANLKQVKLLPVTVIGRAAECQLKIASTQVSRRHCRITVTDKDVVIEDLNSANGTWVNQEKLPPGKPTVVAPGATLHIGPAAFVVDYTPPLTLEEMPTSLIKSNELPFLKGPSSEAPPIIEPTTNPAVTPDQTTAMAPEKRVGAEAGSPAPSEQPPASTATIEAFVPAAPQPATPLAADPVVAPVMERKTVVSQPAIIQSVAAVPVAAVVKPPPTPAAEQTTTNATPADDTVNVAPQAAASAPPPAGFDFLNSPKAADAPSARGFDFDLDPATPGPAGASSKSAAPKKSLFGLFGKKEKAASPVPEATLPTLAPPAESAASSSDTSIDFFDVQPSDAAPASDIGEVASHPVPAPAPEAADDPFAFLK